MVASSRPYLPCTGFTRTTGKTHAAAMCLMFRTRQRIWSVIPSRSRKKFLPWIDRRVRGGPARSGRDSATPTGCPSLASPRSRNREASAEGRPDAGADRHDCHGEAHGAGEDAREGGDNRGHSIARSARSRSSDGIVRPKVLAILRLITSSNVVGCSTSSSPGLAPLGQEYEEPDRDHGAASSASRLAVAGLPGQIRIGGQPWRRCYDGKVAVSGDGPPALTQLVGLIHIAA